MYKSIPFLMTIVLLMTGCNLSEKTIQGFIKGEKTSVTQAKYTNFLEEQAKYLSPTIAKDFIVRLSRKPVESDVSIVEVYCRINEKEGRGTALYKKQNSNEFYLIEIEFQDKEITNYRVKTLYDTIM